jgi:two-component system response regulator DegU
MDEQIKIAIAEDFALEREGLIRLLQPYKDLEFVFCASNGKELVEWLATNTPDVIMLDLNMHIMSGTETFGKIMNLNSDLKVIIFTEYFVDKYIIEFMKRGARAFLSKNNRIEKVADTIRRVHHNGICIDPIVSNILTKKGVMTIPEFPGQDRGDLKLTAKEILILRYMCQGLESKGIAVMLSNAIKTIENHRSEIWRKTACENIPELMEFGFKHGLITF